jgi:hypothetical protein
MKSILLFLLLSLGAASFAQDTVMKFQSSTVNLNPRGENTKTSEVSPVIVTVDMQSKQWTIKTDNVKIKELFRDKMTQPITQVMGEVGEEFSLTIDQNIFAHFYLDDRNMIMFTRNDIHPMRWGLMLNDVSNAK